MVTPELKSWRTPGIGTGISTGTGIGTGTRLYLRLYYVMQATNLMYKTGARIIAFINRIDADNNTQYEQAPQKDSRNDQRWRF